MPVSNERDVLYGFHFGMGFGVARPLALPVPFRNRAFESAGSTIATFPQYFRGPPRVCPVCGHLTTLLQFIGPYRPNMCFFCWRDGGMPLGLHPTAVLRYPSVKPEKSYRDFGLACMGHPWPAAFPVTHASSYENNRLALTNRQTADTPPPPVGCSGTLVSISGKGSLQGPWRPLLPTLSESTSPLGCCVLTFRQPTRPTLL